MSVNTYVFSIEEKASGSTQTILMENTSIERALDDLYGRGIPDFKILAMLSEPTTNPHTNGQQDNTSKDEGGV